MTNVSYFEVYTEGDEVFTIDVSKYADGRSGRRLPRQLTLRLLAYRYRPAAPSASLFPPRMVVTCAGAFDKSGQVVTNEVGNKRRGASVALKSRFNDSWSQCVDSEIAVFPFEIQVGDGDSSLPSTIVISITDGAVLPSVIDQIAGVNMESGTNAVLKGLMNQALISRTYGNLNAFSLPINLARSFFFITPPPPGLELHEDVLGPGASLDFFIGTSNHSGRVGAPIPFDRVNRAPLYFARTSSDTVNINGGVCYAVVYGGPHSTWVNEMLQKGSSLSFFYRVNSVPGDAASPLVIQRFDVLIGGLLEPPLNPQAPPNETMYPTSLIALQIRPYVSVYKCFSLPLMEELILPTGDNNTFIGNSVVIPIRRTENPCFSGTFSLSFDD